MVLQGLELLVVLVIADADDGDAGALDGGDQLAHTSPVATTHAIHLIHDQADLQTQPQASAGQSIACMVAEICRVLPSIKKRT